MVDFVGFRLLEMDGGKERREVGVLKGRRDGEIANDRGKYDCERLDGL